MNELREPTQARINGVIVSSIGTAFTVFLIVGLAGYTTYGSNVASDLLKSYPGKLLSFKMLLDLCTAPCHIMRYLTCNYSQFES